MAHERTWAGPPETGPQTELPSRETPTRRGLRSWLAGRGEGGERRPITPTQRRVLAFTWLGIFSMLLYALFMVLAMFAPGYSLVDRIASIFLLLGIMFIPLHGFRFANSMLKASWG